MSSALKFLSTVDSVDGDLIRIKPSDGRYLVVLNLWVMTPLMSNMSDFTPPVSILKYTDIYITAPNSNKITVVEQHLRYFTVRVNTA